MKSVSADSHWTFYWGDIKREGDSSGATETSAKTTTQKVANKNSFYDENQRETRSDGQEEEDIERGRLVFLAFFFFSPPCLSPVQLSVI